MARAKWRQEKWRDGLPAGSSTNGKLDAAALSRFEDKYITEPNTGCWLWIANTSKKGYGQFKLGNRSAGAHIFSYEHHVGKVPPGLELDHAVCETRCCVNWKHLEAVTHAENIKRADNFNKNKTHCPRGHEYSGNNIRMSRGQRMCRICRNEESKLCQRLKRAAKKATK